MTTTGKWGHLAAVGAVLLGAVFLGGATVFVRLSEVGPFSTAFWRMTLALPLLALGVRFMSHRREAHRQKTPHTSPTPQLPWKWIIVAGLLFAGDLMFWHLSILKTSLANAALFANFSLLVVAFGAWMFLRERAGWRLLTGFIMAISGGLVILLPGSRSGHLEGDLYGLVTALFFGVYVLLTKMLRARGVPTADLMLWGSIVCAAALAVISLAAGESLWPQTGYGWMILLAVAWIGHVGGQTLLTWALGHLSATYSSLAVLMEPVAAAYCGWLILSEPLGTAQIIGGGIVLAGMVVARPKATEASVTQSVL